MIAVGVDTHKQRHVIAALDHLGQLLGEVSIEANTTGYAQLVTWAQQLGEEITFGIEGAGSYDAGLCEYLRRAGLVVREIERPRRRERRAGKSDRIDARTAAKRVLANDGLSTPRGGAARSALQRCWWREARAWASARVCLTSCKRCTSPRR